MTTTHPIKPGKLSPAELFTLLYPNEAGCAEFRLITKGKPTKQHFTPWPFDTAPHAVLNVPAGYQPYYGLSLRHDSSSGGKENCKPTHLVWQDLDLKGTPYVDRQIDVLSMAEEDLRAAARNLYRDVMTRCAALNLPPLLVVYSGHGLQIVWARHAATTTKDTDRFNLALCAELGETMGADPKVAEVARVFRAPISGSFNLKNPARPLPVEAWLIDPLATVTEEALEVLAVRHQPVRDTQNSPAVKPLPMTPPDDAQVIAEHNRRNPIHDTLLRYGHTHEGGRRYTRPGEGASGNDVVLLENSKGVLCSYHHSSNDPIAGLPEAAHLLDPFDHYRINEHGGDVKAAVRAAAAEMGMAYPAGNSSKSRSAKPGTEDEEEGGKRPPVSTRLMDYAVEDGAEFWHDQYSNAYVTVQNKGHREHYRMPSRAARDYLQALFYGREQRALNGQAQTEALGLMQAIARREGEEYQTAVRVAHLNGFSYLDLGTATWEAVEVGPGYWKVIKPHECPIRFTRPAGLLPLHAPVEGGTLEELGEFLNTDKRGLLMCTAWLIAAISGMKPFPLLAFSGEQGTGKSTAATTIRNLIDPNQADRRRAPKEERDLFVAAQNTWVVSLDNLSSIPGWLSDSLCVFSTGGAYTARTLYSDNEETILEAVRPVIVNGIPDLLARPDLAERALTITLQRIPTEKRVTEAVFWARYERARPRLLGALCTALANSLQNLGRTELTEAPRLADFARLIVAGETSGGWPWAAGEFLTDYAAMQNETAVTVLDGEPVAEAIKNLVDVEGAWMGTVKKLLEILGEREYGDARPPQFWPKTSRAMGAALRRLAPALSKTGYSVTHVGRNSEGERYALAHIPISKDSTYTTYTTYTESVPDVKNPVYVEKPNVHSPANVHTPEEAPEWEHLTF